jgi:hypothetical protein
MDQLPAWSIGVLLQVGAQFRQHLSPEDNNASQVGWVETSLR